MDWQAPSTNTKCEAFCRAHRQSPQLLHALITDQVPLRSPDWGIHPRQASQLHLGTNKIARSWRKHPSRVSTPPAVRPGRQTGHQDPLWIIHPRKGSNLRTPTPPAVRPGRRTHNRVRLEEALHVTWPNERPTTPPAVRPETSASSHSGLDRPSHLPTTARLHLLDDKLLVRLGFRVRPIRDGGGKTSPGRIPPPLRSPSTLATKGPLILAKVQSVTKFQGSINQHEKQRAFPDALLREVRHILVGPDKDAVHQGQPFYLEAIHDLAKQMNDVDQDYPLILREGVPLGVSEPTLTGVAHKV